MITTGRMMLSFRWILLSINFINRMSQKLLRKCDLRSMSIVTTHHLLYSDVLQSPMINDPFHQLACCLFLIFHFTLHTMLTAETERQIERLQHQHTDVMSDHEPKSSVDSRFAIGFTPKPTEFYPKTQRVYSLQRRLIVTPKRTDL